MNFSEALIHLKTGARLARTGWNGKGLRIQLQEPDGGSRMTKPYIFIADAQHNTVPWAPSQTDVLAEDWVLTW